MNVCVKNVCVRLVCVCPVCVCVCCVCVCPVGVCVLPLLCVLEVGLMVSVPGLPFRCTVSHVLHQGLGGRGHLCLVDNLLVHTPGSLHHADGVPPPAVAVLLPQVGGGGGDPGVVASHNLAKIGHGPVG